MAPTGERFALGERGFDGEPVEINKVLQAFRTTSWRWSGGLRPIYGTAELSRTGRGPTNWLLTLGRFEKVGES